MSHSFPAAASAIALCAVLSLPATAGAAVVESAGMFRNHGFLQSSDTLVTEAYAFLTASVVAEPGNSFTSADLSWPSANEAAMVMGNDGRFDHLPASFSSLAEMNAAYQMGTYAFTFDDGAAQTSLFYGADNYAPAPLLTGGSYSALQGMNAAQALTLTVSPLDASGSDLALVFFGVYRVSNGALAFTQQFLPPSTTSIEIGAGVLEAGTAYVFDLDQSRRSFQSTAGTTNFDNMLSFESRTFGYFTTAVPEPASASLMALGLLLATGALRRRG